MPSSPPDPALVYESPVVDGPTSHVLAIGIGDYPHLENGSGPLSRHAEGMGQLVSPPLSARAFVDWVLTEFNHPERPLGSVALIASEAQQAPYRNPITGQSYSVPSGTADEVEAAIQAWVDRAQRDPHNLAIFFFCGHGLAEGSVAALLLRDYGGKATKPFDGALNLPGLLSAMASRPPNHQLFIIDSCRITSATFNANLSKVALGRTGVEADPYARVGVPGECLQSVLHSTIEGAKAYGRPGEPSVYTQALLKAFRGPGANPGSGQWWVETTSLQTALHHLITRGMSLPNNLQTPETMRSATFGIHLPTQLEIPTFISCTDGDAMSIAQFSCRLEGQMVASIDCARDGLEGRWELPLSPDKYEFGVIFPADAPFRSTTKLQMVSTPITFVTLSVKP